jgi:phenylalanyl-tRNA synthetase beta subunit
VGKNMTTGVKDPRVFELNKVFQKNEIGEVVESLMLQLVAVTSDPYVATSLAHEVWKKTSRKPILEYLDNPDFGEKVAKGVWLETYVPEDTWICVAQVSNSIKKSAGIPLSKNVWSVTIYFDKWEYTTFPYKVYTDEKEFPSITRSYSFQLEDSARRWVDMKKTIEQVDHKGFDILIKPVERYAKDGIESLTLDIEYSSKERTLTKEEVETFEKTMVQALDDAG